jgi:hypothetical protein
MAFFYKMSEHIHETISKKLKQALIKYSDAGVTDKASYHALEFFYPDYLQYLGQKPQEDLHILEVGVYKGGSMRAWMEVFPKAHFYGIDWDLTIIEEDVKNDPRLSLIQAHQADPRIRNVFPGVQFDLIIDDASHSDKDQQITFELLKDRLSEIGRYVIEDVYPEHTYPKEFTDMFAFVDITHIKGRGDDRLYVYPPSSVST